MGDLQSKLVEMTDVPNGGSMQSMSGGQPAMQQQYYQKIMPQGPATSQARPGQASNETIKDGGKKKGFFSGLRNMMGGGEKDAGGDDPTSRELNKTLQLLQQVEDRAVSRTTGSGGGGQQQPMGGSRGQQQHQQLSFQQPSSAVSFQGVPPPGQQPAGSGGGGGEPRRSRSRASFQLQNTAQPNRGQSGLPADPHDGGPHEDVKDMSTYLRLDAQRDYRFMWVAQLAMSEPVPNQWKEMYDEQGYPYYVNQINGRTSRRHPSDAFYNQLVKYEKIRELTEGPRQEVGAWMDFTDFDGSTYYYNFEINMSSSHRPHFGLQNKRLIDRLKLEATIELEHYIATKVQSMWRRHLVKKVIRERKKEVDAAITIQRAFRRYINRDLDKRRRMAQIHSARRIQAHYRGKMARRRVKEMSRSRNQHLAATKIQARFRGRKARRSLMEPYVRRIQANWRGYQSRKLMLPLMQDRALFAAVVKVQAAWRAKAAKTMAERRYRDQRQMWAAMKVQAHWRGFVTRLEYERMLEVEYEQNAVAAAERRRRQRKELESRAASTIQNSWRVYKARQFLQVVKAVLAMQRSRTKKLQIEEARAEVNHLRKARNEMSAAQIAKAELKAALTIQRYYRGYVARIGVREQEEQGVAAIKMQAMHRRKQKRTMFKKQQAASTTIANRIRTKQAKNRMMIMKATLMLQTRVRAYRKRKEFKMLMGAIYIQKCCRGMLDRMKVLKIRKMGAVVIIQRCYRGHAGRERIRDMYVKVWAAVTIQRMARGMFGRLAADFRRLEKMASRIQSAWRGKMARKGYLELLFAMQAQEHVQREEDSATFIQSCWRAKKDRQAFKPMLEEQRAEVERMRFQNDTAVVIQAVLRMPPHRKQFLEDLHNLRRMRAAVKLQTWWRTVLAKRVVELSREARDMAIMHQAATFVQKHYRRHAATVAYHNTIAKRRASILYLQSAWRMKQAKRERHRRVLFAYTVNIQARYRGKNARRRSDEKRRELNLNHKCAAIIQAVVRGYTEMQQYDWWRIQIGGAITIQTEWRRWVTRRDFVIAMVAHKQATAAATVLQTVCRTTAAVRTYVAVVDAVNASRAAILIQAKWRQFRTRRWFCQEIEMLKEAYRQRVVDRISKNYEHHIDVVEKAAVRVQKHFRGYIACKRVQKQRERQAAIAMQRSMRGYLGRARVQRILSEKLEWMVVSSLLLPTQEERDKADLRHLRAYAEQLLMLPAGSRQVRRFFWIGRIKWLCATLVQKMIRGKIGRRIAINRIRRKVTRLTFGPPLRAIRHLVPEEPRPVVGKTVLRRMEQIIIKHHDLKAAEFVQRCYRGRLGRRFMRVIRGHSNINKIRRVMMPIVMRTTAADNRSGELADDMGPMHRPAVQDAWAVQRPATPNSNWAPSQSEPFLNDAVKYASEGGFSSRQPLQQRPASVDIGSLRRQGGGDLQFDGIDNDGGLLMRLGTAPVGVGVRPRRHRRTRDVLVQPRSTYVSLQNTVRPFARAPAPCTRRVRNAEL
jgi:hypothetical protein